MLSKHFKKFSNEKEAVAFLRRKGLLDKGAVAPCPRCGGEMKETKRKERNSEIKPTLRCNAGDCQTFRQIRNVTVICYFNYLNNRVGCKFSLSQSLELIFYFTQDIPCDSVHELTDRGTKEICDWFNMCRKVCSQIVSVSNRGKMVGTEEDPVQIDIAWFVGRPQHHRGRMMQDHVPESNDSNTEVENTRNHGGLIDGPWVFGLKKGGDCRYFYVQRRNRETLEHIIQREVEENSVIDFDDWPTYSDLNRLNYRHLTVNHQRHYVDPNTGANTQAIERSYLDSKLSHILKKIKRVNETTFQSHLDYYCWRIMRKNSDHLFLAFLADVQSIHR